MITCNVPNKDINLRLSCNQMSPAYLDATDSKRLEAMKAGIQKQGFVITIFTNEVVGQIPIYRIVANKNDGESHMNMMTRVAFQHDAIYRVIATSSHGFQADPSISRFIDSFGIK